ncbi:hypothetical protein SI65_04780 [Aspergillus cristatus]|uniref:Protein kinase domain-containing protein n=1 Tax=Aspergillus cristatus TaxID=573508 RepID=A0A1E3BFR7_ASPCR|nr:hypothetical protein SI65_04780 [Aspergillus cristatus]
MFSVTGAAHSEAFLQPPEFSPCQVARGNEDFSTLLVKIGDFGGVARGGQSNQWPVTPIAFRAPELIYRKTWDAGIDIWALGCLIFELATNEPLFPVGSFGLTAEQIDQEHIYLVDQVLDKDVQMHECLMKHLMDRLPSNFGR